MDPSSPAPHRRRPPAPRARGWTPPRDPYGHGSSPVGADRDRREATVAGAIIRYNVSSTVLIVTVVRLLSF
ncbi:hypothetical protein [Streptomyces buecherae]|uniref:hypothetical protein n=1 Tax=Streptomyces buecherae TaxID=2763006 RepID=UPI00355923C0